MGRERERERMKEWMDDNVKGNSENILTFLFLSQTKLFSTCIWKKEKKNETYLLVTWYTFAGVSTNTPPAGVNTIYWDSAIGSGCNMLVLLSGKLEHLMVLRDICCPLALVGKWNLDVYFLYDGYIEIWCPIHTRGNRQAYTQTFSRKHVHGWL